MSKKRIIQLIFYNDPDAYPPIVNGVRMLSQAGWHVELLCRNSGERWNVAYPAEAKVIRLGVKGLGSWQEYMAFVGRVLRRGSKNTSLIYAHDMHAFVPARLLATMYHRPLVYHSHDFADHLQTMPIGSRLVRRFQGMFARTADSVVIPDVTRAKIIAQALRLKGAPLIAANAPIKRPLTENPMLRHSLAKAGQRFDKIVFRQGRIGPGHAIEATLHSLPFWSERRWGFAVMGLVEPSYVEKLMLEARSLGVEDQFIVLPPVGYDQVSAFTPAADLGHALYEPIHINNVHITTASNKIMEYMEAGLPLLVSDTPSLRAHVEKYRCGVVADEQSPESIAAAVNTLLGDPKRAAAMGASARRAFEDEFCYDRQFAGVLDAFERLL